MSKDAFRISQARQNRRTCMPPTEPQTIPFGAISQGKVSMNLSGAVPQESVSKQGSLSSPIKCQDRMYKKYHIKMYS